VIPHGFAGLEAQLWLWLIAMIRPGAAFVVAPIFSAPAIPLQVRLILALAIGIPALAAAPFLMPVGGIVTLAGFALVTSEVLTGLALGFAVQIGFSSALLAGETIGNTMGLGFASLVDPANGQSSPALGQLLSVLGTFLFLSIGGHLMLATIIIESYKTLPPGEWLGTAKFEMIAQFGGEIFASGLAIALPVGFSLVLVQLVMAMLARSAPALNLFAVGLPATLMAGIILLAIAMPVMGDSLQAALEHGLALSRHLAGG
jgi:flagellar biosynthesis protein FliR